jgi:hypothetical protein
MIVRRAWEPPAGWVRDGWIIWQQGPCRAAMPPVPWPRPAQQSDGRGAVRGDGRRAWPRCRWCGFVLFAPGGHL